MLPPTLFFERLCYSGQNIRSSLSRGGYGDLHRKDFMTGIEIFLSFIFFHLLAITRCLIFPLICSIVAHSHPNQDMGHLMCTENKS